MIFDWNIVSRVAHLDGHVALLSIVFSASNLDTLAGVCTPVLAKGIMEKGGGIQLSIKVWPIARY